MLKTNVLDLYINIFITDLLIKVERGTFLFVYVHMWVLLYLDEITHEHKYNRYCVVEYFLLHFNLLTEYICAYLNTYVHVCDLIVKLNSAVAPLIFNVLAVHPSPCLPFLLLGVVGKSPQPGRLHSSNCFVQY